MAIYRQTCGTILNTDRAEDSWDEARDWDGNNHVGRSSGSQWLDQRLYRTRKGRWYIETLSRIQGTPSRAELVSEHEAARWLLHNEQELPAVLAALRDEIEE